MSHRRYSILRPLVSALGACAVAFSFAACMVDAPPDVEEQDAPELEGDTQTAEPAMLSIGSSTGGYTSCLGACGEYLYECNRACREFVDQPNRGPCFNWCQSNYGECLQSCDRGYIFTPPW
ncbi:hypothetical protein WMF45_08560 [Sorangium sp. So ce448]|uniref:hypothetical protein n=1 Tax=Sorangium sp. So ce448 TaxID=3133314 RepID=UPI003F614D62